MKIFSDKKPHVDIHAVLTTEQIADIKEKMHHYPDSRAASLDALKIVQKQHGWVNDVQVAAIAQMLDISVVDVEGVATFYNRIYRQPVGRNVILLCDSIACYLTGSETLADVLKKTLNIEYGQTTADGKFTLLPVCCLGNCDKGPSMMINDDTIGPVKLDDISIILGGYQ